ncbi:bile acid:sodium symporter family protein [Oceanobacter mangrovi]|uniref:bile acid:sodium symporter family protein n=1 Tax=Oceanobacter mangrovi TaxID=2862510 RepID=UPI001C8D2BA5|nr:bile acid:sodium symporter [Oceanobacter mangrovi]
MQQLLSQIILPVVLAFIMFSMGLGLEKKHFSQVIQRPVVPLVGLVCQMLMLPSLALVIIVVTGLEGAAAAGLFLLSLCPGGATSNMFAWLAGGNVALSISLTAITSLMVPLSLPLLFGSYLTASGDMLSDIDFPVAIAIKQLVAVTLVPVLLGMALRHWATALMVKIEPYAKKLAALAMALVVIALLVVNGDILLAMLSLQGVAVLLLAMVSMAFALLLSRHLGCDQADSRTIAVEVGIQNAGTALLVAMTVLQRPELAAVPLMYGLLMNLPGFGYIGLVRWLDRRRAQLV